MYTAGKNPHAILVIHITIQSTTTSLSMLNDSILRQGAPNGGNESIGIILSISPSSNRIKPGPKPRQLHKRIYHPLKAVRRVECSYSQQKKVKVLMFLHNHWIAKDETKQIFHRPTYTDAEAFFKIPSSTICNWNQPKHINMLVSQEPASYGGTHGVLHHRWPELEERLFTQFRGQRGEGKVIRRGWLQGLAIWLYESYTRILYIYFDSRLGGSTNSLSDTVLSSGLPPIRHLRSPQNFKSISSAGFALIVTISYHAIA